MELAGTSAIVTGGASGIGAASARALTKRGARCVLIDLNDELGEAMASELGGLYVKADVANPEQVQVAVDAAAEMAPLRALVNAAGIGTPGRTVDREGNPLPLEYFVFLAGVTVTYLGLVELVKRRLMVRSLGRQAMGGSAG